MLKWLSSLATAISDRIGKSDRLDAATRIAIAEEDVRDSGDLIEPRGPASNVNRLDELERVRSKNWSAFLGSLLAAFEFRISAFV